MSRQNVLICCGAPHPLIPIGQWWTGPSVEGETQFTDEAVDWIDTVANDDES
jgi:hypothetical protein